MADAIINDSSVANNPVPTVDPNAPTGPVLEMVNGRPVVSSRQVADHFGRQHNNVIRSIEAIVRNAPESFGALNFERMSVDVEIGNGATRKTPAYLLTRDGFVIVAMGFTGAKAIKWKIAYIQAFNAMEADLARQQAPAAGNITPAQQQELQNIVAAKASAFPREALGRVRAQIWSRLHNKFKVAKYDQLPASTFPEAVEYLVSLEVLGALPAPEAVTPALPAIPDVLPAELDMRLRRMRALKREMIDLSSEIYHSVRRNIRPTRDGRLQPAYSLLVNLNYVVEDVLYGLDRNLDALEHLCFVGERAALVFPGAAGTR